MTADDTGITAAGADPWGLGVVAVVAVLALAYLVRLFRRPRASACPSCGKEKTCAVARLAAGEAPEAASDSVVGSPRQPREEDQKPR